MGATFRNLLTNLGLIKAEKFGSSFFYSLSSSNGDNLFGNQGYSKNMEYFETIPELNAVINKLAIAESNIKREVYTTGSRNELREVDENNEIKKLLEQPNWFQAEKEFNIQKSIFRRIFGNAYIYYLTPLQNKNYKAKYNLPPDCIYISTTTKKFFLETGIPDDVKYYWKYPGDRDYFELNKSSIIHLNDNRVQFKVDENNEDKENRTNYLYGTSKIGSLTICLENIKASHEARNTLRKLPTSIFTTVGKDGLGGAPMLNPQEKDRMEALFKNKYGLTRDKGQIYFTSMPVTSNPIDPGINNLMLYEECTEDLARICDVLNYPFELLANIKGNTFENRKMAERDLYQNSAMPTVAEELNAENKKLKEDGKGVEIIGEYHHLPIFQDNMKERATAINLEIAGLNKAFQDGVLKPDEYRKELAKFDIVEINEKS